MKQHPLVVFVLQFYKIELVPLNFNANFQLCVVASYLYRCVHFSNWWVTDESVLADRLVISATSTWFFKNVSSYSQKKDWVNYGTKEIDTSLQHLVVQNSMSWIWKLVRKITDKTWGHKFRFFERAVSFSVLWGTNALQLWKRQIVS